MISGIEESAEYMRLHHSGLELERRVCDLEILKVDTRPSEVFRIGRADAARPLLVKVILSSTSYWRTALSNARLLRCSAFANVDIRKCITPDERKHEYELRQIAQVRNRGKRDRGSCKGYNSQMRPIFPVGIRETSKGARTS